MPTTIFSDTGTGTDGDLLSARTPVLGASYSVVQNGLTFVINSNQIRANIASTGLVSLALANPVSTTPNDQSIQADLSVDGDTHLTGLVARYVDPDNYYWLWHNNFESNKLRLHRRLAGVDTLLSSSNTLGSAPLGYTPKLSVIGDQLRVYVAASEVGAMAVTDSALASGKTGLLFLPFGTASAPPYSFDNIVVQDETVGGGGSPVRPFLFGA